MEQPQGDVPEELIAVTIPAATWAIFDCIGAMPHAIQALWKKIYEEWFPSTGYEQAQSIPDLEVYMPGNMDCKDYRSQIWLPITTNRK